MRYVIRNGDRTSNLLVKSKANSVNFNARSVFFSVTRRRIILTLMSRRANFNARLRERVITHKACPRVCVAQGRFLLITSRIKRRIRVTLIRLSNGVRVSFTRNVCVVRNDVNAMMR